MKVSVYVARSIEEELEKSDYAWIVNMAKTVLLERIEAEYEEAQSRLRLSMICRATVRELTYPLDWRIVELAAELAGRQNGS